MAAGIVMVDIALIVLAGRFMGDMALMAFMVLADPV
jgi:hypothetical protein